MPQAKVLNLWVPLGPIHRGNIDESAMILKIIKVILNFCR